MASIINASNSGFGGIVSTGDSSGELKLQTTGTTALTIDTSQNVSLTGTLAMSSSFLRNRIINGAMVIDQRNAGASVTPTNNTYLLDRYKAGLTQASKFSVQQSSSAPAGYTNSMLVTSLSAYSIAAGDIFQIVQIIEGYNVSDLAFGTASAKTITLSFWVRSSLTGTFGGAIQNNAQDRSYPFSYTISTANTWTQISVTITGDTTGTWLTTNGRGMLIIFSLGTGSTYSGTAGAWVGSDIESVTGATSVVGTSGATFYITGVQLEIGSTATPFERRLYSQELANCQRYYEKSYELLTVPGANTSIGVVHVSAASNGFGDMLTMIKFNVEKRTAPTMTFYREDGTSGSWNMERSGSNTTPSVTSSSVGDNGGRIYCATGANWTVASLKGHWTSSAEL